MERNFFDLLGQKNKDKKFIVVGLDTDFNKIPLHVRKRNNHRVADSMFDFNKEIINATKDIVGGYKINSAFYEAGGGRTFTVLGETIEYIQEHASDCYAINDAKRGDIGNTAEMYDKSIFEYFKADAVTLSPFMGSDTAKPFLGRYNKGCIILCKTSNDGSGEFQDATMLHLGNVMPLYECVARTVVETWNYNNNCLLVVGANKIEQLKKVREIVGDMDLLIPAVGKQGGSLIEVLENGLNSKGEGVLINQSRDVIYASDGEDFADAARGKVLQLNHEINNWFIRNVAL